MDTNPPKKGYNKLRTQLILAANLQEFPP